MEQAEQQECYGGDPVGSRVRMGGRPCRKSTGITTGISWLDQEGAAVLRVYSSRPSRPTTKLNVGAAVEFGEFAAATGRCQSRWWLPLVLSTGVWCGRRGTSVSVVVSRILLIIIIIALIAHRGQVQGVPRHPPPKHVDPSLDFFVSTK